MVYVFFNIWSLRIIIIIFHNYHIIMNKHRPVRMITIVTLLALLQIITVIAAAATKDISEHGTTLLDIRNIVPIDAIGTLESKKPALSDLIISKQGSRDPSIGQINNIFCE